ncbi:MAG: hypothetical protein IT291_00330 [Deltaproteobacteria bacterium]|nr:hypothetical protein [Deltaproteobacteria bacterium]
MSTKRKVALKKKLTLSVDSSVIEAAKLVAESQGESLSVLVENFLRKLSFQQEKTDWLDRFHAKYLGSDYKEPSDDKIAKLRDEMYS